MAAGARAQPLYPAALYPTESFDISLPRFDLRPNESIGDYRCEVVGGGIVKIRAAYVWNTIIKNGEGDHATVEAGIIVGTATLHSGDLGFFDRFVTVAKPKPKRQVYPPMTPFDVSVELGILKGEETDSRRVLKFTMKQLIINPAR